MTFPPEYNPTSQPGGAAQPEPMGNQPYGWPGQDYAPLGQQYIPPGQQYTPPDQQYAPPGQQYAPPGQTFGQPNDPYGSTPGMQPYQPGQPVGVPDFQPAGASALASAARKRGIQQIAIGAVLFLVGLVITLATYGSASSSRTGGTYFIAYGPMIFGVISMIRGAIALAHAKKLG